MMKPVAGNASRAPRGAKSVSQAFFAALAELPEAARGKVAKAAQAMIREELKLRGEKAKAGAARLKARTSSSKISASKPAATTSATPAEPPKRRGRKPRRAPAAM